jgi:3-polyprenyl-4-hydroxybenzoate decarboxylase
VADPAKPERLVVGISGALGMIYGMRALEMPRPLGIEKVSCTPALTDVSSIARGCQTSQGKPLKERGDPDGSR